MENSIKLLRDTGIDESREPLFPLLETSKMSSKSVFFESFLKNPNCADKSKLRIFELSKHFFPN